MNQYKNQHLVTESYLKAWLDPKTPQGAYLWIASKQDKKLIRKSPKKLFVEDDFYTVYDSDRNRIIEIEKKLKEIEDKFILLRNNKIRNQIPLTPEDRKTIALFTSATFARTKREKEENKKIWEEYIEFIESLPSDLSSSIKQSEEYKLIQSVRKDQPMPYHLYHFINMTAPYLFFMNCAIYEIETETSLITSDNPCLWIDPTVFESKTSVTFMGLGSPKLNIILPISPKQYISLERKGPDGYIKLGNSTEIEQNVIIPLNKLTVGNAEKFIVTNDSVLNPIWFD